jgi:hypothetical protein
MPPNVDNYLPIKTHTHSVNVMLRNTMDKLHGTVQHNPASFRVATPNVTKATHVVKMTPMHISVPRMFNNVTRHNNTCMMYYTQDSVLGEPYTSSAKVEIPIGLYNIVSLVSALNIAWSAAVDVLAIPVQSPDPVDRVWEWAFDASTGMVTLEQTLAPPTPPQFGSYLAETLTVVDATVPGTNSFFQLVGLSSVPVVDITRDGLQYKGIDLLLSVPADGGIVTMGPPNLSGPLTVYVELKRTGDNYLDGSTGVSYPIVGVIHMGGVPFGSHAVFTLGDIFTHDTDFDIGRSITEWDVTLTDGAHNTLTLPPNQEVELVFKLYHTDTKR